MPRRLVGQLDKTFRPGGRENNKEISNDAKTKVPLCESLGSNLGLNTQSITKNWSYVWNCPHLRLVEWHKTSYLGHNSPNIAKGTMDLKVKNVRHQQNKLSPEEARQWAESGVIEMTKKAESKTWRLFRVPNAHCPEPRLLPLFSRRAPESERRFFWLRSRWIIGWSLDGPRVVGASGLRRPNLPQTRTWTF